MYNLTVLPASTAAILINGWCKAKHLNDYFICTFLVYRFWRLIVSLNSMAVFIPVGMPKIMNSSYEN
jgi:hypothetical protein